MQQHMNSKILKSYGSRLVPSESVETDYPNDRIIITYYFLGRVMQQTSLQYAELAHMRHMYMPCIRQKRN